MARFISAYKTDLPIVVNGDLEKYRDEDCVSFEGRPSGGRPRSAAVNTLWDEQNLYIAFDVHSSRLQAVVTARDGRNVCMDDGVEFLIDPLCHRSREFLPDEVSYRINILNVVCDERGVPSGAETEAGMARQSTGETSG
jgi:hypothetical protein